MKKRGQVFSSDLVIGMGIFVITLILFFNYTKDLTAQKDKKLPVEGDFLFNNIEYGIRDNTVRFLENYKVNEGKLNRFAGEDYETGQKPYVLGNFPMQGFNKAEFCIYFTKMEGNNEVIIRVNGKTGTGYDSADIKDRILVKDNVYCGMGAGMGIIANPLCGTKYTHAVRVSKPVLFDYTDATENNEIAKMNVLICAEAVNE